MVQSKQDTLTSNLGLLTTLVAVSLTISPTSVTALGLLPQARDKGLSLRFPRFIRIRGDKSIELASTPSFVRQLWTKQESKGMPRGGVDEGDLVDYIEAEDVVEDEYESDSEPT